MNRLPVRLAGVVAFATIPVFAVAGPASAHPHVSSAAHQGAGQVLANGANHGAYVNVSGIRTSCGGDPGSYGLESAHHGPDSGTPGNADGCYQVDAGLTPAQDVASPVIR